MRLAAGVAFALVVLAGCATIRQRAEVLSFTADDGTWTLSTMMLVMEEKRCFLGFAKPALVNAGKMPIGGSYIATISDAGRTRTLGEFTVHCPIAAPGVSASCSVGGGQSFTLPCEPFRLHARPARPTP